MVLRHDRGSQYTGARYQAVFEYMEIFYNRTRMHASPNDCSPAQAESHYLANVCGTGTLQPDPFLP